MVYEKAELLHGGTRRTAWVRRAAFPQAYFECGRRGACKRRGNNAVRCGRREGCRRFEESREDEEQVHTAPPDGESREGAATPGAEADGVGVADIVARDDEKNGETAKTVKFGDARRGNG